MNALTPRRAGVLLAVLQAGLLVSLGGVYLIERARQPRGWAQAAPVDPEMPIRGRYVTLNLLVPAPGLRPSAAADDVWTPVEPVRLIAHDGRLEAVAPGLTRDWPIVPRKTVEAQLERINGTTVARLYQPLAFFIPPDVPDPSQRPEGEQLWVEVTLPAEGLPRPIRLGVSRATRAGDTRAAIQPLRLRP